jgi:hypothetical protein
MQSGGVLLLHPFPVLEERDFNGQIVCVSVPLNHKVFSGPRFIDRTCTQRKLVGRLFDRGSGDLKGQHPGEKS